MLPTWVHLLNGQEVECCHLSGVGMRLSTLEDRSIYKLDFLKGSPSLHSWL